MRSTEPRISANCAAISSARTASSIHGVDAIRRPARPAPWRTAVSVAPQVGDSRSPSASTRSARRRCWKFSMPSKKNGQLSNPSSSTTLRPSTSPPNSIGESSRSRPTRPSTSWRGTSRRTKHQLRPHRVLPRRPLRHRPLHRPLRRLPVRHRGSKKQCKGSLRSTPRSTLSLSTPLRRRHHRAQPSLRRRVPPIFLPGSRPTNRSRASSTTPLRAWMLIRSPRPRRRNWSGNQHRLLHRRRKRLRRPPHPHQRHHRRALSQLRLPLRHRLHHQPRLQAHRRAARGPHRRRHLAGP